MGATACSSYERLTIQAIPPLGSPQEILDDFDKLDLWSNRLDSEYPINDINYNEGKDKISHPFHKISKFYGRNKDVFKFLDTLRSEKLKGMIMRGITERCGNNTKLIDEFAKKISVYLKRIASGEAEAEAFLNDPELHAFFNGYHIKHGAQERNIHENLNINVSRPGKTLDAGSYFGKTTPMMTAEKSELKKVKFFANGQRAMILHKVGEGKRNYMFNKQQHDMDLEIGWTATNDQGKELMCVIILNIKGGKIIMKKMVVEGEHHNSVVSLSELAKQNPNVLIKNKSLHELLAKMLVHHTGEAAIEIACVVQSNQVCSTSNQLEFTTREKLTVHQVPQKAANAEDEVLADFEKLVFSSGPFSSSDEINYNDGLDANPFDKIAKVYGRHKDVFAFNAVITNPENRARVMEIARAKCDEQDEEKSRMLQQFEKRLHIYLERISEGAEDAKAIFGDDEIQGFFYGNFIAKQGQPRNIHTNFNVNVTKNGQAMDTKGIFTRVIPRMISEKSEVERVKIFGSGKRIMNVVKGVNGQRNYTFSKLAKMDLEIEWVGREAKTGRAVPCNMVLEIKGGQLGVKVATIDGVYVKLVTIHAYAEENKEVLIRNKSLSKTLEDIFTTMEIVTPFTIDSIKAKVKPMMGSRSIPFDCNSREVLTVHQLTQQPLNFERFFKNPEFKDVMDDFEKLDFSAGPFDPSDVLNYNEGLEANPFNKIRKYYGRYKDIFLFITVLYDEEQKEKVMDMVRRKCGGDQVQIAEFEKSMQIFLDRAYQGRRQAMEFLGEEYRHGVVAFFAGYHMSDPGHKRNLHANLNIDLGQSGLSFDITDYFNRQVPNYDIERGGLERIKIFGNAKRIVTVFKKSSMQRNYNLTKFAEMDLEIKWKAMGSSGQDPGCSSTPEVFECAVVLKLKNGDITISKASLDGKEIQAAEILEMAKQNDKICFRNKTLYDVIQMSTLKSTIKGATTLFFNAAGRQGDATKLNNSCTDIFMMLMLQDHEEKERILDIVAKRSPKPIETRDVLVKKIEDFQEMFQNGEYVYEGGQFVGAQRDGDDLQGGEEPPDGSGIGVDGEMGGGEQAVGVNAGAGTMVADVVNETDMIDDDAAAGENPGFGRESLILLGAADYPIEFI